LSIEGVSVNIPTKGTGLQSLVERILRAIGEDPKREGLLKTPERVEKSLKFLTSGYDIDVNKLVNDALYSESYNEMVIVKDIDVYSLCEHHMLPFFGKCHVAYLPQGKIIGLSKVPRLIDAYSRRLQVQERLTTEIAQCIQSIVKPAGVAVVIDALHLCMSMRGVQKQNSYTTTSSMLGCFKDDARTRSEFLSLLAPSRNSH